MQQNQHLQSFSNHKIKTTTNDLLKNHANCECSLCISITDEINPQIYLDQELIQLQKESKKYGNVSLNLNNFLEKIAQYKGNLPNLCILDTIVLNEGIFKYMLFNHNHKLNIQFQCPNSIAQFLINRKNQFDLQYQKNKYLRNHSGFTFTQLQHQSQKIIKQFENNLKLINPQLNRIVILKLKGQIEIQILNTRQFIQIFSKIKHYFEKIKKIQYLQIFPIMYGNQQDSYIHKIKYFRKIQCHKQLFKLAQSYSVVWNKHNQSIDRMQQQVHQYIKKNSKSKQGYEKYHLLYQTYKILLYFENICELRVLSGLLQFITNDQGNTFWLINVQYLTVESKMILDNSKNLRPTKRQSNQKQMNLRQQMKLIFNGFQKQYLTLNNQWLQIQNKAKEDQNYSTQVFRTINKSQEDQSLQSILSCTDPLSKSIKLHLMK